MALISDKLNSQLDDIIGKCFAINRMLDRGMSLLKVRWKLIHTSNTMHPKVAHAYPAEKFADGISDYQAERGNETIYPATPIGNKEYNTPLDFFMDYYNENIELENMIKDAIDESVEEGDNTTTKFLNDLLMRLSPYTALSQDLIDLFGKCDNDAFKMQILDFEIDDYINV